MFSKVDGLLNRCRRGMVAVLGAVVLAVAPAAQADLIGLYEFNGNLNNSITGPGALGDLELAPMTNGTRQVVDGRLQWSDITFEGGLNLKLGGISGGMTEYSIGIVFTLMVEELGYNKILDFANLTDDSGLYKFAGSITAYPYTAFTSNHIYEGSRVIMVFTRTPESLSIYVEGSPAATDSKGNDLAVSGSNGAIWFFTDDMGLSEFAKAGFIEEIRIWNTALSEEEARAAFAHIPEPSAVLLGLGVLLALQRWKRRRS